MKVLIVSSTQLEVKDLMDSKLSQVDFLICGVGIPSCMYELSKILASKKDYDLIINAGIAGSFDPKLEIGRVVRVHQEQFGDVGIGHQNDFLAIQQTDFSNAHYSELKNDFCPNALKHLKSVSGITVNTVSYSEPLAEQRKKLFGADVESMEGAAFFLMMQHTNIPYLQIRSISNYVGESNKKNWNIPLSIKNLQSELKQYLQATEQTYS